MESRIPLFTFCLLWVTAINAFKDCEHVFNCAKNKSTHSFELEFCPNRFPATTRLDFTHYLVNFPKGIHYPMNKVIGYVEVYTSDSETPIYSGSDQKTCEELKAKTKLLRVCPIPAHSPFKTSGAYNYTLDFKLPADHYRIHFEIYNENQDLEVCMEIAVEVYDTETPPEENNSTTYTPIDIVADPGEAHKQKPVHRADPPYTIPNGGAYDQSPATHQSSGNAPLASSCGVWIFALLLLALSFRD